MTLDDEPLNILQVSTLYPPMTVGGAERVVARLSEEFHRQGDHVSVACIQRDGNVHREDQGGVIVYRAGLENIFWPFSGKKHGVAQRLLWHWLDRENTAMGNKFVEIMKRAKPEIVITHNIQGWSSIVWARCREHGIPVVHVLHDHSMICPRTTMNRDGHNCAKPCTECWYFSRPRLQQAHHLAGIVSVSKDLLHRHQSHHALPCSVPTQVIYNSLSASVPPRTEIRSLPPAGKKLRFGFMGRIEKPKGIEVLLTALHSLKCRHVEFDLSIAGQAEPGYLRELLSRFPEFEDRFLGHQPVLQFMDSIDVLVVPSLMNEGLGNVTFEAMARGALVIGSNLGGIAEVLEAGQSGLLFPAGDANALGTCIQSLIEDRDLYAKLQPEALKRALFFRPHRQSSDIRQFLRHCLSRSKDLVHG